MSTKRVTQLDTYFRGHGDGYTDARGRYERPAQVDGGSGGALTQHDLDTISMGIALVVVHAADIKTIEATMGTQQKLGIAEKVLGWLHLAAGKECWGFKNMRLCESAPNPWLNIEIGESIGPGQAFSVGNDVDNPSSKVSYEVNDDEIPS